MTAITTSPGLHPGQFRRIAEGGFGDGGNSYPHAMAWFKDCLYVGTTRHVLVLLQKRSEDLQKWNVFPIRTAKGNPYDEFDFRSQVWRYNPAGGKWTNVLTSDLNEIPSGKPIPSFQGVRNMMVWQRPGESSPHLYLLTWSPVKGPGPMLIRTPDGENFERVPFGKEVVQDFSSFRPLVELNGKIYTAPSGKVGSPNSAGVAVVFESDDPLSKPWRQVNETNFGDNRNESIFEMVSWNGHVYVATLNPEGFQLWKSRCEGKPPYTWTKILDRGAWRGQFNETLGSLFAFNGSLYLGSCIVNGGYDRKHGIGPAPVELMRIHPDDTWDLIMGEGRMTPAGFKTPLSGLGPGFDKGFNTYLWRLCVHDGWLYAGTFAWSGLIPFIPREKWPGDRRNMADAERTRQVMEKVGGFDLWRSRDGVFWVPVTRNGFGNMFNWGVRTLVSTPHGLFVGAANPFGPDVAVERSDGWSYEPNPRGGLEVWLGSDQPHTPGPAGEDRSVTGPVILDSRSGLTDKEERAAFVEALVDEFYGHGGLRSCGRWRINVKTAKEACLDLVNEVLAPLRGAGGNVLHIGPSTEAERNVLTERFGSNHIATIPLSATSVEVKEGLFDVAVNVETLSTHAGAVEWVKRAGAALKPGGFFGMAAVLSANPKCPWKVETNAEFKKLLNSCGFSDVHVTYATEDCWNRFRQQLTLFIWDKALDYELDDKIVQDVKSRIYADFEPLLYYVIVHAKR